MLVICASLILSTCCIIIVLYTFRITVDTVKSFKMKDPWRGINIIEIICYVILTVLSIVLSLAAIFLLYNL